MSLRFIKPLTLSIALIFYFLTTLYAQTDIHEFSLRGYGQFIKQTINQWNVPGLAIAIVKDGEVIFSQGFGFRDLENGLKVTPKTFFAISSCTKAFTATAAGILVDGGKLDWDTPIRFYLPSFKMYDPFASERMTVRDLLTHRSGLSAHDKIWYNSLLTREELFDRLQYIKPNKDFRSVFQYQNIMYMVVGYLIAHIGGTSWEEFVRQKILAPLEMQDTNFSLDVSKETDDYAVPYTKGINDEIKRSHFHNTENIGPAGSINSTIQDMAKWLLFNLNKGKWNNKQIISSDSLKEIHSPQITVPLPIKYKEFHYTSYGMGWFVTCYRGHLLLYHSGGIDGFISWVSFMPNDNIGVVILTNNDSNPLPTIIGYNAYDRLLGLEPISWNSRMVEDIMKAKEADERAKRDRKGSR
jgi:CubicO group peptidase (beta-lactamase class C family)